MPSRATTVDDEEETADMFAALRDAGVFSWGREWSPVEVFRLICGRGLLEAPLQAIGWREPDDFDVREMR